MPPTSRLTAATAPSSAVRTLGGAGQHGGDLLHVAHAESRLSPPARCGGARAAGARCPPGTFSVDTPVAHRDLDRVTSWLPAMRRWKVAQRHHAPGRPGRCRSWTDPCAASSPITSQASCFRRMVLADRILRRRTAPSRTVAPMMQTALPARTSLSVKTRPPVQRPVAHREEVGRRCR